MSAFILNEPKQFSFIKKDVLPSKEEELFSLLFTAVFQLHKFHLQTVPPNSFAIHLALGTLYDSLPRKIDSLVETIQGKTQRIVLNYQVFETKNYSSGQDCIIYLKDLKEKIESYRLSLDKSWANIDNQLQTFVDDIESTIYKLTFLQ